MNNLLAALPFLAGTFRSKLNDILTDYGVPLLGFIIILSLSVGLARNFSKINSDNWGDKKEGLFNLLIIVAYVFLIVAVLAIVVSAVTSIDLSI